MLISQLALLLYCTTKKVPQKDLLLLWDRFFGFCFSVFLLLPLLPSGLPLPADKFCQVYKIHRRES